MSLGTHMGGSSHPEAARSGWPAAGVGQGPCLGQGGELLQAGSSLMASVALWSFAHGTSFTLPINSVLIPICQKRTLRVQVSVSTSRRIIRQFGTGWFHCLSPTQPHMVSRAQPSTQHRGSPQQAGPRSTHLPTQSTQCRPWEGQMGSCR